MFQIPFSCKKYYFCSVQVSKCCISHFCNFLQNGHVTCKERNVAADSLPTHRSRIISSLWIIKQKMLYSWRFSRYSAPIHWLVHGHMTSNNITVSCQMPWAGNIAKTMTSNGKQFTVTHEMLTAVARDRWNLSAVFKFCFCFVLFCYITNHLMTGPLGISEFCLSVYCY